MQQSIILEQISFLAILIIVGVIASKIGVIKAETRDALVKIIFNITLPLLLFTNFSTIDLTPEILSNSLVIIALTFISMILMLGFGYITSHFFRTSFERKSVYIVHHSFGNILYFGFPVVNALFGDIGLFYAGIVTFVSIMLLWTAGVYILTRNGKMDFRASLKKMVNPNSVAILAGFILFLVRFKLPDILLNPLRSLGSTTLYLSMLYIGAVLGLMKIKGILSDRMAIMTTINKNFIFPILLIFIFSVTTGNLLASVDKLILYVLVIEVSMPCMANIVIVARMFNVDDQLAASNVFLSTLTSILSLPFIYFIMDYFLG